MYPKILVPLVLAITGVAGIAAELPTLHVPAVHAESFVGPDGRTWHLRWSKSSPDGGRFDGYTPEPAKLVTWSEMLTIGFKGGSYSTSEEERRVAQLKRVDKGITYTKRSLGNDDFVTVLAMPAFHSATVTRVIRAGGVAYMIGYEDRREKPTGLTVNDWARLLEDPTLKVSLLSYGTSKPDAGDARKPSLPRKQ